MYWPNLQSVALAVPEIILIAVLEWGCWVVNKNEGVGLSVRAISFQDFQPM